MRALPSPRARWAAPQQALHAAHCAIEPARVVEPSSRRQRQASRNAAHCRRLAAHAAAAAPASPTAGHPANAGEKINNYKVAVFSAQPYVVEFMQPLAETFPNVVFIEERLSSSSAHKATGCDAVCLFVNDDGNAKVIDALADAGVRHIAMRCAGFDRLDLSAAAARGLRVARVPTYSPASVAEMALALLMTVARKLHLAIPRAKEGNYTVSGLTGRELASANFGIVGTGAIGAVFAHLALSFQKHTGEKPAVYAYDLFPRQDLIDVGVQYVELDELLRRSDVVSLHCPLLPSTFHIIDKDKIALMKDDCILINVSRGGLVDTGALLDALYEGKFFGVAMDVYEKEGNLFFKDYTRYATGHRIRNWDREFAQLKSLPQVVITPHIAFSTAEALSEICAVTAANLTAMCLELPLDERNEVKAGPKP